MPTLQTIFARVIQTLNELLENTNAHQELLETISLPENSEDYDAENICFHSGNSAEFIRRYARRLLQLADNIDQEVEQIEQRRRLRTRSNSDNTSNNVFWSEHPRHNPNNSNKRRRST